MENLLENTTEADESSGAVGAIYLVFQPLGKRGMV